MTTKKHKRKPVKPLPFDRQTLVRVRADSVSQRLPGWHPIDWTGQNWAGARAEGGYFVEAILRRANLSGAWLSGADLTNANLSRSILQGTELWGANLTGANFLGADISGAVFNDRLEGPAIGLTQAQIDSAMADPDDPPLLEGVLDAQDRPTPRLARRRGTRVTTDLRHAVKSYLSAMNRPDVSGLLRGILQRTVQAPLRILARLLERVMLEFTLLILLGGGLFVWWQWDWLTDDTSGSAVVRNIGLVLAAVVALPIAIWRSRVAEQQADTAHRVMLDQRLQQALEMVGHNEEALQVTGIYALMRLSAEYPEFYEDQVAEVLDTIAQFPIGATDDDVSR